MCRLPVRLNNWESDFLAVIDTVNFDSIQQGQSLLWRVDPDLPIMDWSLFTPDIPGQ
jgi:hypothetical protein